MPQRDDAPRDLLFGLLALQNGMVTRDQLVAAFGAWTAAPEKPLSDLLAGLGALRPEHRPLLDALVGAHLKLHGDDPERSLAALELNRSTRESLAAVGGSEVQATLAHVGSGSSSDGDADRTASYAVGAATGDGQRFRVLRPHARGGLGAVFVALDEELHREVALKQILEKHADDPASRARFLIEAEITGGLEHPGIVPIYGLGTYADGRPFYAMRFIKGDSLKEAADRFHADEAIRGDPGRRALELRKLLRRFTDVCDAIGYAHARGVLHRDIKPGNIIVGRYGETLVVDWGLAKATGRADAGAEPDERTLIPSSASGSAETLPGSALGTPAYMSPEQAEGDLEHLGPRSDVYSLGATLYYLLTGRPPVEGEIGDVLRAVQRGEFPPPRRRDATIDPALEAVCLKAMSMRPDDRYPSPRALAEDVERWMADEPVSAWREPWARALSRRLARHRTIVTAAGAALVAGVIGLAAVLGIQARANTRLERANADLASANARVIRANADLEAATERERQRFDLAMAAIKLFHGDVSADLLLKERQFEALRTKLLRGAADFYGKLEGLLSDQQDTASRAALGRAYDELGELMSQIGNKPEALAVHGKALAVRRELAVRPGADAGTALTVARSLIASGRLRHETGDRAEALASYAEARSLLGGLDGPGADREAIRAEIARSEYWTGASYSGSGRHREAMAAYERARAILAELTASHPEVVEYRQLLSWCDNDTGVLLWEQGRVAEALAAFRRSGRIKQEVADAHPGVVEFRRDLAIALKNIGVLLAQMGHPAEAMAASARALAIRQELADANPAVTRFRSDLARDLTSIGILLSDAGRADEALSAHGRAVAILERLADENPAVTLFRSDLANAHGERGDTLRWAGRIADARASYERAVAILERLVQAGPIRVLEQGWLVQDLKGLGATRLAEGRVAEAVAAWRRAVTIGEQLGSDYGEALYYLAGCHARLGGVAGSPASGLPAGEGAIELDRAMDLLRRAVAAGYRSFGGWRRDPDLDPLRWRPDFQLLQMDVAFPADAFAHGE
jgi:serine/threonine protein kinase/tetratricopeptide (TPR) repeat protein